MRKGVFRAFFSAHCLLSLSCSLLVADESSRAAAVEGPSREFLRAWCVDCHSGEEPSADRNFEQLDLTQNAESTRYQLQEIIDQLTLGTMPPTESGHLTDAERLRGLEGLRSVLGRMRDEAGRSSRRPSLRRLSKREYRNTVGDLFGFPMDMCDPTTEFPDDLLTHEFDNIGSSLTVSGFLLEQYLAAADSVVDKALAAALCEEEPAAYVFREGFLQQQELSIAHRKAFNYRYMVLYDHPLNDKPEGAFGHLPQLPDGVPCDGTYEVQVLAQALHRDTPYSRTAVDIDLTEPFRLGIRPGDTRIGDLAHTQPLEPLLAEVIVEDEALRWYTFEIPLDQGFSPRFTFENGQHDVRGSYGRIFRLHRDLFPAELRNSKGIVAQRNACVKQGYLPQIRIHEVRLTGPLSQSSRTEIRRRLFGGSEFREENVPRLIGEFVTRAFRRPVTAEESERWIRFYGRRRRDGREALGAYADTLKAILSAPGFLFFSVDGESQDSTNNYLLAERLAYFLTSGPPDDELLMSAAEGQLTHPEGLVQQADRLLESEKADRFFADFADSWLGLRSLGAMPPDPQEFRVYYRAGLQPEMKRETQLFLADLIRRNAPAIELLTADFTFANRDLAKLYGVADQIPIRAAGEFHRVRLADANRRGLLGQASILTNTANGVETSPVTRGVWILDKILGTPPPPPPDDVPALDPDVRGTTSIRDRLAKHRQSAACNQCHRKIDPPGFALEYFDPIGRSRTFYDSRRRVAVDCRGTLADGREFDGPGQLIKALRTQEIFFVRNFTRQLATYAVGREMGLSDRAAIDEVIEAAKPGGYRLRDLLHALLASPLFREF